MSIPHPSHDPSARFAGTSPSQDPRRGGMISAQLAQSGRDSRDDGAAARTDALLGTPNKVAPVPQTNLFSTSPRLEQQAPAATAGKETGSGRSKNRDSPVEEKSR
jgi:hypothetical protein